MKNRIIITNEPPISSETHGENEWGVFSNRRDVTLKDHTEQKVNGKMVPGTMYLLARTQSHISKYGDSGVEQTFERFFLPDDLAVYEEDLDRSMNSARKFLDSIADKETPNVE